jgi:hypothetical protein
MSFETLKQVQDNATEKAQGLGSALSQLKEKMVELYSTIEELDNIERGHKLGYLPHETYLLRHDQLTFRKNLLVKEIRDEKIVKVVDKLDDPSQKPKFVRLKDAIISHQDAINTAIQLGRTIMGALSGKSGQRGGQAQFQSGSDRTQ